MWLCYVKMTIRKYLIGQKWLFFDVTWDFKFYFLSVIRKIILWENRQKYGIFRTRNPNGYRYMTACSVLQIIKEKQAKMTSSFLLIRSTKIKKISYNWPMLAMMWGNKHSITMLEGIYISMIFLESNLAVSIKVLNMHFLWPSNFTSTSLSFRNIGHVHKKEYSLQHCLQ